MNYVALHTHSEHSLLDGYGSVEEYVLKAKELGMKGIGLTDHGTMGGIYELITLCKKHGIIPVPGVELYVAPENPLGAKVQKPVFYGTGKSKDPRGDVAGNGSYLHFSLWAYNEVGLANLYKLVNMSYQPDNFYSKPRVDTDMLAQHSEGIIAATGCPASEICKRFFLDQNEKAYEYASRLKSIYGENLYVEIMNHNMADNDLESKVIPKLIKLARDMDLPIIATNDSHYADKADAPPHERMLCMQAGHRMSDLPADKGGTRFAFSGPEYYVKDYYEMLSVLPDDIAREALENTEKIALKASGLELTYNSTLRPFNPVPAGYTDTEYLKKLIRDGFNRRRGNATAEVKEESSRRVKLEFEVLHSNDFIQYFLVVYDYIDWARKNGVSIGPGRGSVGGSEIAYLLGISDTDPIRFNLLFERFLSPGRGAIYTIENEAGEKVEMSVSDKVKVKAIDGKTVSKYVHELKVGDEILEESE